MGPTPLPLCREDDEQGTGQTLDENRLTLMSVRNAADGSGLRQSQASDAEDALVVGLSVDRKSPD